MKRLGLDIGTNSIGWVLLNLNESGEPTGICDMGVRIFSDGRHPKDKTSLAVARRTARQMRRQRDRKIQRKKVILNMLIALGLFPKEKNQREELKKLNPLELRSKAVNGQQLSANELGRAILHLAKKRGFKSNRKELRADRETQGMKQAIAALKEKLQSENLKSYGEFLFQRVKQGLPAKASLENADFFPSRAIIEQEFDLIVEKQKAFFPQITSPQWNKLKEKIFYQRPLKPVEVGLCSIYPTEKRGFRFLPSFETYRLLCELHNLRWRHREGGKLHESALSPDQIQECLQSLREKKEIKYSHIKMALGLDPDLKFTIEAQLGQEKIKGCPTHTLMGHPNTGILKEKWWQLTDEQRDQIADSYFSAETTEELAKNLSELQFLTEDEKKALLDSEPSNFADTTCSYSSKALIEITQKSIQSGKSPLLVIRELQKVEKTESFSSHLEYYGKAIPDSVVPVAFATNADEAQYGKIANPTVHIGLNQLRRVVNEIIDRFGKPDEIHIELARELKLSKEQKALRNKQNRQNEQKNEKARQFIRDRGLQENGRNLEKVKLWFEINERLDGQCIYTGQKISQDMVLTEQVEIDHIWPFSRSLDDGWNNKILVTARGNRLKGDKTPYEAFGQTNEWPNILMRAERLPDAKYKKFATEAMERYFGDEDFLGRQLTDTAYLTKIAKKYLSTILPEEKIICLPGRLTALIRGKLGLNKLLSEDEEKNRNDHRHHCIDGLVVALTNRSFLQKMATATDKYRERVRVEPPWPNFIAQTKEQLDKVVVSHRVEHSPNKKFVEDTAYKVIKSSDPKQCLRAAREDLVKLINRAENAIKKSRTTKKKRKEIVSNQLRKKAQADGLASLKDLGIKRLRMSEVCKERPEEVGTNRNSQLIKVQHGENNQHHSYYRKNGTYKMTLWKMPNQKYKAVFTYYYDYLREKSDFKPHPAAKKVLELHNGDTIALERNGKVEYHLVKSLKGSSKQIQFLEINLAKKPKDQKAFKRTVSRLESLKLRKIFVSPTGKVWDPGPIL